MMYFLLYVMSTSISDSGINRCIECKGILCASGLLAYNGPNGRVLTVGHHCNDGHVNSDYINISFKEMYDELTTVANDLEKGLSDHKNIETIRNITSFLKDL